MHHERAVIEQDPLRVGLPFAVGEPNALAVEALDDGFRDGLDLRLAPSRTEQEILCEGSRFLQIEDRDVNGLLVFGHFDGPANFGANRVRCHRYRACPRM